MKGCVAILLVAILAGCSAGGQTADRWSSMSQDEISAIRRELLERGERDQAVRTGALAGAWDVDSSNTAYMKTLIDEHGWPPQTVVGKEASTAAFLMVQHADHDPEFQTRCLPLLEAAAAEGEVSTVSVAYLTDRVRVKQGRPQVYGTQYDVEHENGKVVYLPPLVEDVDGLDERRAAAGLKPWIEYERRMAEMQERDPVDRPRSVDDE